MGSHPTDCLRLTSSLTSADPALRRDMERRNSLADRLLIKVTVGGQEAAGVRAAVCRGSRAEQSFPSCQVILSSECKHTLVPLTRFAFGT